MSNQILVKSGALLRAEIEAQRCKQTVQMDQRCKWTDGPEVQMDRQPDFHRAFLFDDLLGVENLVYRSIK